MKTDQSCLAFILDLKYDSRGANFMKRLISVLLLTGCIMGCRPSSEIEGVWGMASVQSIFGRTPPTVNGILFDFEGDSVFIVTLDNWSTGVYEKMSRDRFYVNMLDSFIDFGSGAKSERFNFIHISADSLVLGSKTQESQITLKPIRSGTQSRVQPEDLIGQSFKFEISPDYEENIDFINDSILLYGSDYRRERWSINSYKGHEFLNNSFFGWGLFTLSTDATGQVQLSGDYTSPLNYTLSEVVPQYEGHMLRGRWTEKERHSKPPLLYKTDTLDQLEIGDRLFISKRFKKEKSHPWKLTNDGKAIYFTDEQTVRWKILELSDTIMVLKQLNSLPDAGTTITYERISDIQKVP